MGAAAQETSPAFEGGRVIALRSDRASVIRPILAEAARAFNDGASSVEITLVDGVGVISERYPLRRERPFESSTVFGYADGEGGADEDVDGKATL